VRRQQEREPRRQVGLQGRAGGQNQKPVPEAERSRRRPFSRPRARPTSTRSPRSPRAAAPRDSAEAETLIQGNGAAIKSGQQATVNYVGVLFKDGKEFDASWGKGKQPFQFALGGGQVIPGWDRASSA